MPYVKRDEKGTITAVTQQAGDGFTEHLDSASPELSKFLQEVGGGSSMDATDQDFIRVLEDVVELLIDKRIILFTELPSSAQEKIMHRQSLRSKLSNELNLIGED